MIISKDNHDYIFISQCNQDLFLYQELRGHYKEAFSRYDLGLIKSVKRIKEEIYDKRRA